MNKSRVFVGGLPQDVCQRDMERFFDGYGRIAEIALKGKFGFVEFTNQRDADDAVHDLDGKKLLGRHITVQNAQKPRGRTQYQDRDTFRRPRYRYSPARRTDYKVMVENLSSRVQWQDLKDFLTKVGKVTYAKAHNKHRNQGTVEFATYDDMKRVIEELDGAELNGRRIKITEARRSRSKSRSPLVRYSKSPSKSRKLEEGNSNLQSLELSRKRSRENSEDNSGTAFKRTKRRDSASRSP